MANDGSVLYRIVVEISPSDDDANDKTAEASAFETYQAISDALMEQGYDPIECMHPLKKMVVTWESVFSSGYLKAKGAASR